MINFRQISIFLLLSVSGLAQAVELDAAKVVKSKALPGNALSDPNMAGSLIQTTLGLLVVLAVIAGVAWAFKRFGNIQAGGQGKLKIVGGISLGTRERVVLLQVGNQQLVIGVAPGQIQTLHVLDEPLAVDNETRESPSFSSRLQSAMARHVAKKIPNNNVSAKKTSGEE